MILWMAGLLVQCLSGRTDTYVWQSPTLVQWVLQCFSVGEDGLLPLDVGHFASRFGEFVMLVLGESALSLIIGLDSRKEALLAKQARRYSRYSRASITGSGSADEGSVTNVNSQMNRLEFSPSMLDVMQPWDYGIVALGVHMCYILHSLYFNSQV